MSEESVLDGVTSPWDKNSSNIDHVTCICKFIVEICQVPLPRCLYLHLAIEGILSLPIQPPNLWWQLCFKRPDIWLPVPALILEMYFLFIKCPKMPLGHLTPDHWEFYPFFVLTLTWWFLLAFKLQVVILDVNSKLLNMRVYYMQNGSELDCV